MYVYRYSRRDDSLEGDELLAEELMEELSNQLMSHGSLSRALHVMRQTGIGEEGEKKVKGLLNLLKQLRTKRQELLDKYKLSELMNDLRRRLDQIVEAEREGIKKRLEEARQRYEDARSGESSLSASDQEALLRMLERLSERNNAFLDSLPKDVGGAIDKLKDYEFTDSGAKEQFDDLMQTLQKLVAESHFRDLHQRLQGMSPENMATLKEMVKHLNRMLEERMAGRQPDFEGFMEKFGAMFGEQPPSSFEQLIEEIQRQLAQMQSLMASLDAESREALQKTLNAAIRDEELQRELSKLVAYMENFLPLKYLRRQYPFQGEEPVTLTEAMKLIERLQRMDELERRLRRTQQSGSIEGLTGQEVQELLGEEAYRELEKLKQMIQVLEEAGYIRESAGEYELTPRGMRKIGHKALMDIFTFLKRDRLGQHEDQRCGVGIDSFEDTKGYEFGDPFFLHVERSLMNAIQREGAALPLRMSQDDFEVYRPEHLSRSSTVVMLDLSLSMAMRGNFYAAKRVALALHNLIQTRFPRDGLYIVGFSTYAREMKPESLPYALWDEFDPYTNMQHGFLIARKLLSKGGSGNKQIIIITDGEPTAHIEHGQLFLQYPPSLRTVDETLREVKRCTEKGIIINTFMLDTNRYLKDFVDRLTKINRGRVFYTTADKLGEYVLVDYIANKRRRVA